MTRISALLLAASLLLVCSSSAVAAPDPTNATFQLDLDTVTLANGRAERPAAPGSASKVTTTLTDQRVAADLDGDGRPDTAVILVRETGGTGSFHYLVVLLNRPGGVKATPGVLLGDRIKVNALRSDGKTLIVDMLDRAQGEPLTAAATVNSSRRYVVAGDALVRQ